MFSVSCAGRAQMSEMVEAFGEQYHYFPADNNLYMNSVRCKVLYG